MKAMIFGIKITPQNTWGIYTNDAYVLGNYEEYNDADQAVLYLYAIMDALVRATAPIHIPSKELGIPFLFAYIAADSLQSLGLITKHPSGKYTRN